MKGYITNNGKCYIFPQTAGEIPAVEANAFYVQEEDYAAWIEENEQLADKIKKYNYNIITKLAKEWAGHTDDDLEPPVVLYDITYTGDTTHVTGPATGAAGDTITITPTTAAEFNDITLTSIDASITKNAENWTFTMPESDVTVGVAYNSNHISKSGNTITLTLVDTTELTDPLIAELVDEQASFGYCSQIIYANNAALDYYILKGGTREYDEYWFKLTANDASLFRVYKQKAGPTYRIDNINSTYLNIYTCEPVPATIPLNITGSEYISGSIPVVVDNYTITNINCTKNVSATYTGGNIYVDGSQIQLKTSINQPNVLAVNLVIEEIDYRSKYFTIRQEGGQVQGTLSSNWSNVLECRTSEEGTWEAVSSSINIHAGGMLQLRLKSRQIAPTNTSLFDEPIGVTGDFIVEGNIMSLCLPEDDFLTYDNTISEDNQFNQLFKDCTSLTSAENLILPATTLANSCYNGMFDGCTSLTTAPELPATTLAINCYQSMFSDCTSLNYIKCLATDISASQCTSGWVQNVAATGTFVKDPSMSSWTTGDNGIPSGWTVEDAPA